MIIPQYRSPYMEAGQTGTAGQQCRRELVHQKWHGWLVWVKVSFGGSVCSLRLHGNVCVQDWNRATICLPLPCMDPPTLQHLLPWQPRHVVSGNNSSHNLTSGKVAEQRRCQNSTWKTQEMLENKSQTFTPHLSADLPTPGGWIPRHRCQIRWILHSSSPPPPGQRVVPCPHMKTWYCTLMFWCKPGVSIRTGPSFSTPLLPSSCELLFSELGLDRLLLSHFVSHFPHIPIKTYIACTKFRYPRMWKRQNTGTSCVSAVTTVTLHTENKDKTNL